MKAHRIAALPMNATAPQEPALSHEEFKQHMDAALAEIEQAANLISDLGSRRLSKLNNTFVLLTCLGFVPSAMANLEYLQEPKTGFILNITLLATSSVYGIQYIIQYCIIPELLRRIAHRLIQSADNGDEEDQLHQRLPMDLKVAIMNETQATAKEASKTYESLYRRRNYIDGIFQVIMGILSFVLMILILVGPKTDEFGLPALAELIFTVWIFFANITFALVYAFISTRKRRKHMEAAEKVAEKVARDWLAQAQQPGNTTLWKQFIGHQTRLYS